MRRERQSSTRCPIESYLTEPVWRRFVGTRWYLIGSYIMKWGLASPCQEGREGDIPSLAEIVDHDELERWEVTSRCERCCGRISLPASHAGGTRAPADTELTLTQLLRTPGRLPPVARAPMVPVVQHSTSPALE